MAFSLYNFPHEILYLFLNELPNRQCLLNTIISAKFLYHLFLDGRREMIANAAAKEVKDDYWATIPVIRTAIFLIGSNITQDAFALYEGAWRCVKHAKPLGNATIFGHDIIAHNTLAHEAIMPDRLAFNSTRRIGFQTLGLQQQIWEAWWLHVFQRDLRMSCILYIILSSALRDNLFNDEKSARVELLLKDKAWSNEQRASIELSLREKARSDKEQLSDKTRNNLESALVANQKQPDLLELALRQNVLNVRRAMMQLAVSSRDCGWHQMFMTAVDLLVSIDAADVTVDELLEAQDAERDLLVKWVQFLDDAEQLLDRSDFEEPTAIEFKDILQRFKNSTQLCRSWLVHAFRIAEQMEVDWRQRINNKQWGAAIVAADWCDVLYESFGFLGHRLQRSMWEIRADVQDEFWQYTFFVGARRFRDGHSCIPEVVRAWERVVEDSPAHANKASDYLGWFFVRMDFDLLLWSEAVKSERWEDAKKAAKALI